jgi:hypothetical protein
VLYETTDGDKITLPATTDAAYQKITIQRNTRDILEPLTQDGITSMRIRQTSTTLSHEIGRAEGPPVRPFGNTPDAPTSSVTARLA